MTCLERPKAALALRHATPWPSSNWTQEQDFISPGQRIASGKATFVLAFNKLTGQSTQDHVSSLETLGPFLAKAAAIAVSLTIGYQTPIWFCVACPVVLGLLAPLIINAGAGAVAEAACEHYSLPEADCAELW